MNVGGGHVATYKFLEGCVQGGVRVAFVVEC